MMLHWNADRTIHITRQKKAMATIVRSSDAVLKARRYDITMALEFFSVTMSTSLPSYATTSSASSHPPIMILAIKDSIENHQIHQNQRAFVTTSASTQTIFTRSS
jgi:hypothetical protein